MAKVSSTLFLAAAVLGLLVRPAHGQLPAELQLDRPAPLVGSALTCSQTLKIAVPRNVAERARLKVRLLTLLRESLFDDARGIVNIAREKEIKKLANRLCNEHSD